MTVTHEVRTLIEGKNVWRFAESNRLAVLIDGEAYYAAVADAITRARHSICFLAWDIHSEISLTRDRTSDSLPPALGPRLSALLQRRPELNVYVLDWDFPFIFSNEREPRNKRQTRWPDHERFHFLFDNVHPAGASQHQKVVLIDDSLVFLGGMDIARSRWDTPEHLAGDGRRSDPESPMYPPTHDAQVVADGEIARVLGELVRERWKRVAGSEIPWREDSSGDDKWPRNVTPDWTDITVGISRTVPALENEPAIEEVKNLHLDAIASARESIFIENQYLTSSAIVTALSRRLEEPDGPEVVAILPLNNYGWLEQNTVEVLRFNSIRALRDADRYSRLCICYPVVPGEKGEPQAVGIHSKILIIDDRLLRIGSSNLTNRSMAIDTECDIVIESDDADIRHSITRIRNRLLAEHLGLSESTVDMMLTSDGSLVRLIERQSGKPRCLKTLEVPADAETSLVDPSIVDPSRPLTPDMLIERFAPAEMRRRAGRRLVWVVVALLAMLGLSAAWQWTSLRRWVELDYLITIAPSLRSIPFAPLWITGAYVIGSLLVIPVTALIFATVMVFGAWPGVVYALVACCVSAAFNYWLGRRIGRDLMRKLAGPRLHRLANILEYRGLTTMITVRMLPLGPFTIINMTIGAAGIRFRDFALGTFIGMMPGIIGVSVLKSSLLGMLQNPGPRSFLVLAAVISATIAGFGWLRRRLGTVRP